MYSWRLARLHELYSALISLDHNISIRGDDDDETKQLRVILGDIEKYLELLPNPKRLVAGLAGVLAFIASIAALIDLLGLREIFGKAITALINTQHNPTHVIFGSGYCYINCDFQFFLNEYSSVFLISIIILITIAILALSVRLADNRFRTKRMLFLSTNSIYPYMDAFPTKTAPQ